MPVRTAADKVSNRLEATAVIDIPLGRNWKQRLAELAAFKKKHGHCRVSTLSKNNASLGNWVRTQRGRRRRGELNPTQIRSLDRLGFAWDVNRELEELKPASWEHMFRALKAYRRTHGHCRVPSNSSSPLYLWIRKQRIAKRRGKLNSDQINRLDELGVAWNRYDDQWKKMFEVLVKYKNAHGNCDVPAGWPGNPKLATWVNRQRRCHGRRTLPANRRERLDSLGFRFSWQGPIRKSKSRGGSQLIFGPIGSNRRMVIVKAVVLAR
jgi:hypothetical protein